MDIMDIGENTMHEPWNLSHTYTFPWTSIYFVKYFKASGAGSLNRYNLPFLTKHKEHYEQ